jgi:hypothetical protein
MTNQQLIPTEKLLNQWCYASTGDWREIAAIAARWGYKQGADEELEACCEWLAYEGRPPSQAAEPEGASAVTAG